jgi:MFS superfamily sulfate permease-like transporter
MQFAFPDFSHVLSKDFIIVAFTIAVIASLESLLSIDAADKLDPQRRITPNSRELIAQGAGNIVSGFLGGLPVTAVIVRSSANIASGAKTKLSAILHGCWLLLAVIFIPRLLNMIPLAALAAILLQVGFKLIQPALFREMYKKGWSQFIPFVVTIIAIMFSDLLIGIMIGMAVGVFFVIKTNYRSAISVTRDDNNFLIRFKKDVSFVNKLALRNAFSRIPEASFVIIEMNNGLFIDQDIREAINDFCEQSQFRNIAVEIKN